MKQYTNNEQTAKLIELGLPKPKGWNTKNISSRFVMAVDVDADNEFNYSIGELIEMLPKHTDDSDILHIEVYDFIGWDVWYGCYCNGDEVSVEYSAENKELVDALYDMVIQLKEEGVI